MLNPKIYTKRYFLSNQCEGFFEDKKRELSPTKLFELHTLEIEHGDKILDIGCGRGDVIRYLSLNKYNFWGIDYSESAVNLTKSRINKSERRKIIKADARNIPINDNFFDKILIGDVIEHMSYSEAGNVVNESYRLLKPGGRLVIHTAPNRWFSRYTYKFVFAALLLFGYTKVAHDLKRNISVIRKYHEDEYSILDLKSLMKKSDFRSTRVFIFQDVLRRSSINYLSPAKRNYIIRLASEIINKSFLLFLFGNDLFAVGIK
jgi:ubiquinone/menaquinone biosynthesis C-methylase UbiE